MTTTTATETPSSNSHNPAGAAPRPRRQPVPLNGVDTPTLFATMDVVREQPGLARFQFRAVNRWISGTHSQSRIESYRGAGGEHTHKKAGVYDADHPPVLVGTDEGPTPVEFVLHALGACLMAGVGNIAAARGVKLTAVEAIVEGNIDVQGVLGLDPDVRNGYQNIRVRFNIEGDAPADKLREIVEQSRKRSAVFDVVTNGVPVEVVVGQGGDDVGGEG